jgi:hypothetical protein
MWETRKTKKRGEQERKMEKSKKRTDFERRKEKQTRLRKEDKVETLKCETTENNKMWEGIKRDEWERERERKK